MAINSTVIVREVWDTRDLVGTVLDGAGGVSEGALTTRFEPQDLNALELALRLKDEHGGAVRAVSLGAPRGVDVLRECLYRGADAVHRVDAGAEELDTGAAARLLAEAVRRAGPYDLVLVGMTLAEGENSLLGAHLATCLGIAQISYVDDVDEAGEGRVVGKRAIEMGYEHIEASLPALLSVGVALVEDDPRTPRSAKAMLKLKAKKVQIPVWAAAELGETDPAAGRTTKAAGREPVPERVIESRSVDPEDESALRAMLEAVLKGE